MGILSNPRSFPKNRSQITPERGRQGDHTERGSHMPRPPTKGIWLRRASARRWARRHRLWCSCHLDQIGTRQNFFSGRNTLVATIIEYHGAVVMGIIRYELSHVEHPPSLRPRVFTAEDRACAEGDSTELALRFCSIILRSEPTLGSPSWLWVLLRGAE